MHDQVEPHQTELVESEEDRRARAAEESNANFRDMYRRLGNMSEPEIDELFRLQDISTNELSLVDQIRRCELLLKTDNPQQAAKMVAEIGKITPYDETHPPRLIEIRDTVRRYIGEILYFQGKRIGDNPKGTWAEMA
ncbi:MAG: hypothetical protein V4469_05295 [Patescibacteria group bacterium]